MADLQVFTRDQWLAMLQRNATNRNPDMDVAADSAAWVEFSADSDALAQLSQVALAISRGVALDGMDDVQTEAAYGAKVPRQLESKSSGYATVETAASGATIYVGDQLVDPSSKNLYVVTITANTLFANLSQCPIESVDPGLGVNLAAGTVLNWVVQRPGCYASATVYELPDGAGLTGGRDKESLDDWHDRIRQANANPAIAENEGAVIKLIEDVSGTTASNGQVTVGHGVPVEKGFVYPALKGTGTEAIVFTVKKDNWWESRVPNSLQMSTVLQYVVANMSYADSRWVMTPVEVDATVDISISLDTRATQWADFAPWPTYTVRGSGAKVITSSTSSLEFAIGTDDADYTGEVAPVAGNTIGLFDANNGTFVRKKIKSVAAAGPWYITVEDAADASNTAYVPVVGQIVSPWTDTLPNVATVVGTYVGKLGPSQATTDPANDGVRKLRIPVAAPGAWDTEITGSVVYEIIGAGIGVSNGAFIAASPSSLDATTTGVTVNLFRLDDLGVFKL